MTAAQTTIAEPPFASDEYRLAEWFEALAADAERHRAAAATYDPTLPAANID